MFDIQNKMFWILNIINLNKNMITKEEYLNYQSKLDIYLDELELLRKKIKICKEEIYNFEHNQPKINVDQLPKYVKYSKEPRSSVFRYRAPYDDYYLDRGEWSFNYRLDGGKLVIHSVNDEIIERLDGLELFECDIDGNLI